MYPQSSSANFSAAPLDHDHPLRMSGRFGRLSFIAWSTFLNIASILGSIVLSILLGSFNNLPSFESSYILNSLTHSGMLGFVGIGLLYVYFQWVMGVRRLHDLDKSGWLLLLLFVPVINLLLAIYMLCAAGVVGTNQYGVVRRTAVWEKFLAWCVIIVSLIFVFATGRVVSYFNENTSLPIVQERIVKGSEYF